MEYVTAYQLTVVHNRILASSGGNPGIRDQSILEALPTRLRMTLRGMELFTDVHSRAAQLILGIIAGRPFVDANKRVGIAAGALFLRLNHEELVTTDQELVDFCCTVESGAADTGAIGDWLRVRTVPIVAAPTAAAAPPPPHQALPPH